MKCKVISCSNYKIEEKINLWLINNKVEIFKILQTQDNTYVTVTIFYLEEQEIRKKKLNKLNNNERNN